MSAARVVTAVLAVTGAFAIGRLTSGSEPAPAPASTERIVERGPQRTVIERAVGPDLDEVRRVIREELARSPAVQPRAGAVAAAPEAAEADRDAEEALAKAREVLDAGMADGRWSDDDRARLRDAMGGLSPREADELFEKLLIALNAGELEPDVHGAPI